jgi:hypothetical protein
MPFRGGVGSVKRRGGSSRDFLNGELLVASTVGPLDDVIDSVIHGGSAEEERSAQVIKGQAIW